MDVVGDDAGARRETLALWAAEQQRIQQEQETGPTWSRRERLRVRLRAWRLRFAHKFQLLANRVYDRGLDTSAISTKLEHAHIDRTRYVPSSWHVLPRALRYLGVSDDDVFADFGCGKGRVVLQAARWPFRRVIGVEISPDLADIARAGLEARRHQQRCRDVEIVVSEITQYRVPDDLTIGYLYHPFRGETFDAFLQAVIDSIDRRPRRVRLIYVWPQDGAGSKILATGRFRVLKKQRTTLLDNHMSDVVIFESL
jgi:SAM-dependent methyltransferase